MLKLIKYIIWNLRILLEISRPRGKKVRATFERRRRLKNPFVMWHCIAPATWSTNNPWVGWRSHCEGHCINFCRLSALLLRHLGKRRPARRCRSHTDTHYTHCLPDEDGSNGTRRVCNFRLFFRANASETTKYGSILWAKRTSSCSTRIISTPIAADFVIACATALDSLGCARSASIAHIVILYYLHEHFLVVA